MGPTGELVNVIQIHPTLRCNLRCEHCYSSSGPEQRGELALARLEELLEDAVGEGYNAVGISGGEPLTYGPLPRLLASARRLGFFTSVTTNGLLLDSERIGELAPYLSLLAISVDGVHASHDRLRSRRHALEKTLARLAYGRDAGVPFGFIFTLTLTNLDELAWVAALAVSEGARLLQVHPLERVGRARETELQPPDDLELSYGFLEVARLQREYTGRLTIQYDVADRALIEREPSRAFAVATPAVAPDESVPLASLISPLVVQDDGWVVPIQHGFAVEHAIAHLERGRFSTQAAVWKRERHGRFLDLAGRVWNELRAAPPHLPFTNWYSAITTRSSAEHPFRNVVQSDR